MITLRDKIVHLNHVNAIHVNRGFRLQEVSIAVCSNHMIEEAVEAQAEILSLGINNYNSTTLSPGSKELIVEELGDMQVCYHHLLVKLGITPEEVELAAVKKLEKNFTLDESKVTAIKPGLTRKGRK